MSKLKAHDPKTAKQSKPKILVYGRPKVGKTWTALTFPNSYYIDTEGGANLQHYTDRLKSSNGVYMGIEDGANDFGEIIDQVKALATEKHSYKTLIIDSITKVFNTSIAKESERLGDKNAYGADKKPAVSSMRRLINWIEKIDMNVILISHEKALWGIDSKGDRAELGTTFDCLDKLEYELHLILQIQKRGASRVAVVKASRLTGFPETESFPWNYYDFAERYGKDIVEREVNPIQLASTEDIEEVKRLLGIIKVSDEEITKGFAKAQVDSWEEMTTEQINVWIKYLNSKLKG
jgi:hypothetical protein